MVITVSFTTMTMLVMTPKILVKAMATPVSATAFFHSFKSKLLWIVIGMLPIVRIIVMIVIETVRTTATLNYMNLTLIWLVRMLTTMMVLVSILAFMFWARFELHNFTQ